MAREKLGSRLGFILLSAGCAIGMGNVWKFPWLVGQNGGGAFVLIYIFFLLVLGLPVMTMEFALGRASQKSMTGLYQALAPDKPAWRIHGYLAMAGNVILMMFYTCVTGWMFKYFIDMAKGDFVGLDSASVGEHFGQMLANPTSLTVYMIVVVVLGFAICAIGVQKGLERVTKFMMLALLAIMIILAINGFTLDGAKEGLKFYLVPDFTKMQQIGIGKVVVGAMNQAFFTLSLGIGSMAIFGSYLNRDRSLLGESVNIAVLDTFVAITSGLIIFPACFTYDVAVDNGPSLIFVTLPNVFNNLPMGRLWGTLFFLFMSFAAFSTILAVFENIIACTMDLTGWSRKKTCIIDGILMFILSIPCVLGFNVWASFQPLGAGSGVLDLEDFIVSNILLPLGSLAFVVFCTWRYGFGWDKFVEEANYGKGLKVKNWMRPYMKYVLPVIVIALFVVGIVTKVQDIIGA